MAGNTTECGNYTVVKDNSTKDSDILLGIFPREVWLMVLDCLQDPEDLKCASNASSLFLEMLQPRKTAYLFPTVWSIVGDKFQNSLKNESEDDEDDEEEFRWGERNRNKWCGKVLSLRLVCNTWKKGIDKFYFIQSLPKEFARYDAKFANAGKLTYQDDWIDNSFNWSDIHVTKFLNYFEDTHINGNRAFSPFLNGRANFSIPHFYDEPSPLYQDYVTAVTQLLQTYGRHIWICEFAMNTTKVTTGTFAHIRNWLSHLPNLVSLKLLFIPHPIEKDDNDQDRNLVVNSRPLPRLPKLKYLHLDSVTPAVANVYLDSYNHVSILHLHSAQRPVAFDVTTAPFPNLKDLTITFYAISDFQKLNTAQFSDSFSRLKVTLDTTLPHLPAIFGLLARKWATSLKRLKIYIPSLSDAPKEHRKRVIKEIKALKKKHFPGIKK